MALTSSEGDILECFRESGNPFQKAEQHYMLPHSREHTLWGIENLMHEPKFAKRLGENGSEINFFLLSTTLLHERNDVD